MDKAYGAQGNSVAYSPRDLEKIHECDRIGITLIVIPYWWDGTKKSLLELLKGELSNVRTDLLQHVKE